MPDRFRKLRTRIRKGFVVHYFQDRLTGRVFSLAEGSR